MRDTEKEIEKILDEEERKRHQKLHDENVFYGMIIVALLILWFMNMFLGGN